MKRLLRKLIGRPTSFEDWKNENPSASFKDFFREAVEPGLQRGDAHPSLGGKLHRGTYGDKGKAFFERLKRYGLRADSRCVDYGCGTLRIGTHVINYVQRGSYWGMDISEYLLAQGRRLVGEKLWLEKEPHLRVISNESVSEVAASFPDFLFSVKVLIHVHPTELEEYFSNIRKIIVNGPAIISGKWSEIETVQLSELSWAHSGKKMEQLISNLGGKVTWLEKRPFKGAITHGIFCVAGSKDPQK
jgi:SAM-dependent methyltransferase